MSKLLNTLNEFGDSLDKINNGLSGNSSSQGFNAPKVGSADTGLPFTKVPYGASTPQTSKRHLIHWFVPNMGVVKMYVNPQSLMIKDKKLIKTQKTKGGFSLQYWGEDITDIDINGTTGSSGMEGINALYEVYRSEQYTFDAVGLTMSSNNAAQNVANNLLDAGVNAVFGSGVVGSIASSLLSPGNLSLSPKNLPSLADNAFTVEMYYMGWVFRGYFTTFNFTEKADSLLLDYAINFKATQKRGYRTNYLPWQKTPIGGGPDFGSHFDAPPDETGTATSPYYSFSK